MKKIQDIPIEIKNRINKSNLILSIKSKSSIPPKEFDEYGMIIVFETSDKDSIISSKRYEIYIKNNDYRYNDIDYLFSHPSNFKIICLADAVIWNNKIYKNRWGVHDNEPTYTKMMDTMTIQEIKEFYDR